MNEILAKILNTETVHEIHWNYSDFSLGIPGIKLRTTDLGEDNTGKGSMN